MPIFNQTASNQLFMYQASSCYTQSTEPYYGTLTGCDNYMKQRLNTQNWDFADKPTREAALHMATRAIEALAFKGQRANPLQILFFPRTIDTGLQPYGPNVTYPTVDKTLSNFSNQDPLLGYPPIPTEPIPIGTPKVPGDIERAAYEIALAFLNGIDPDIEARNLSVTGQGYAGARTTYERGFTQDHLRAGIPSAFAWSILRPYLADPKALVITRGG